MTWWAYVRRIAGGDDQKTIASKAGVAQSMVSRWQKAGRPLPENAAALARAYGRPVLEAFIAAGFLAADEAGERPTAIPSLATWSDDDLIDEVRRRMKGEPGAGTASAEKNQTQPRPAHPNWEQLAARRGASTGKRLRSELDETGNESQEDA